MKNNSTTVSTSINTSALTAIDAKLVTAIDGAIAALCTLTAAIEQAVIDYRKAGLADPDIAKRVKGLFEKSSKANSVNKALRAAGVRQRGLRLDAGISRGTLSFSLGAAKKAKDSTKADSGAETAEGEAGEASEGNTSDPVEVIARQALKLAGGDIEKAAAFLSAAVEKLA